MGAVYEMIALPRYVCIWLHALVVV